MKSLLSCLKSVISDSDSIFLNELLFRHFVCTSFFTCDGLILWIHGQNCGFCCSSVQISALVTCLKLFQLKPYSMILKVFTDVMVKL